MLSLNVLATVVICVASVWQIAEAGCKGNRACTHNDNCSEGYACLRSRNNPSKNVCRFCACNNVTQCMVHDNGTIYCNCSGFMNQGRYCECENTVHSCADMCPTGYTQFDGSCSCYLASTSTDSWDNAQTICQSTRKGNLVKISSAAENVFVQGLVAGKPKNVWIGSRDIGMEGTWRWIHDETTAFEGTGYENWSDGEPNNFNDTEDCGEISPGSGMWNDNTCSMNLYFVCEFCL